MVVHAQRQARAGLDREALDGETIAVVDAVVGAPGARDAAVARGLAVALGGQQCDRVLDLFGELRVRDQQCIRRVHHQQVLGAQGHDGAVGRVDEGVGGAHGEALAADPVAVLVRLVQVGDGIPAADIAPAALEGEHCDLLAFFEHRVVDALAAAAAEGGGVHAKEVAVGVDGSGGLAAALQDVGCVLLQRRDQHPGLDQQDPGVPEMAACQQQLLGVRGGGLLDEGGHHVAGVLAERGRERLALADIAIGRARKAGLDAEGHEMAGERGGYAFADRRDEALRVRNVMVGRREQQQLVGLGQQGDRGHRRGRVARHGLEQLLAADIGGLDAFLHQEAVLLRGDAGHLGVQQPQAFQREHQQVLVVDQRDELLGQRLARQRPETRAAAAAEDDRTNHAYLEPSPVITVRTVFSRILMSSQSDQLLTYSTSSSTRRA